MDEFIINFKQPKLVKMSELQANNYNPNRMPKKEMELLKQCIKKYGFLFPIVTTRDNELQKYRIIDGYHRFEALKQLQSEQALIVDLQIDYHDAIQLTVLMNRIKGLHQVEKMSDLVVKLGDLGLEDEEIANNLGMEAEEMIRLKQQLGIAHAMRNVEYSQSWSTNG
jgi:ParB-like chromosome segregation protein Spo0J